MTYHVLTAILGLYMDKRKKSPRLIKVIDDAYKLPDKAGNGIIRIMVSKDKKGEVARYSLVYINHRLCGVDNGRVLGYDNSHGYHHRHYMGKEEAVEFTDYDDIAERFDKEWRQLHEKAKKHHN
jgi:hypothetical protein